MFLDLNKGLFVVFMSYLSFLRTAIEPCVYRIAIAIKRKSVSGILTGQAVTDAGRKINSTGANMESTSSAERMIFFIMRIPQVRFFFRLLQRHTKSPNGCFGQK
ncbi:MAG: hypothetical protein IPL32_10780 [Chloracidobacterium sp.]|nr:hypothetical protein [Chloracidobacterium sp.]